MPLLFLDATPAEIVNDGSVVHLLAWASERRVAEIDAAVEVFVRRQLALGLLHATFSVFDAAFAAFLVETEPVSWPGISWQ